MSRPSLRRGPARAALAGVVIAAVLVGVAATAAGAGGDDGSTMTADDAVEFTERALDDAGAEAEVGAARRGTFGLGPLATDVWIVAATVEGREIALSVEAGGDRAVNLADQLADGSNVLTSEQFDALAQFRYDPAEGDLALPAGVGIAAAAAVTVLLGAAVRSGRVALPAV